MQVGRIAAIIQKEGTLELRRKNAFYGIILFCLVLIFLNYKSFNVLRGLEWDVMLWITVMFSGINAIAKSFIQDGAESRLYYYTLFDPREMVVGKLFYNFIFLAILFLLVYLGFSFFFEAGIRRFGLFFTGASLGILGLSVIFTFIAAISAQAQGNHGVMMSVMSLPLTIPILLLLIKITAVSMALITDTSVDGDVNLLLAIDLLLVGLLLLLFEYLWKD